jgi:hypothetical protein
MLLIDKEEKWKRKRKIAKGKKEQIEKKKEKQARHIRAIYIELLISQNVNKKRNKRPWNNKSKVKS